MIRRNIRLRREYLYRKNLEGKHRAEYEKKAKIKAVIYPSLLDELNDYLFNEVLLVVISIELLMLFNVLGLCFGVSCVCRCMSIYLMCVQLC